MALFKIKSAQIYLFFLTIGFASCNPKREPDLSAINLQINIERFDKALDSLTPANITEKNYLWQKQYDQFYADYIMHMLQAGNLQDTVELFKNYREILQNADFNELKRSTLETFPDLTVQEAELTDAFKHIKYYFPEARLPRFIAFFSGFTVQSPVNKNYIGIGLDMFLGNDSKFYPALIKSIPIYISRRFTKENIVPRTVETYLREDFYPEPDFKTPKLLDLMVYNGKIIYLLDRVMPKVSDSLKIGYSAPQLEWASNYASDVWAWFLEENLLYETDYHKIQKHFGEAPFTPDLGSHNDSAPKLGIYLGWQLIRKYMDEHPDISLEDLLNMNDAQQILTDSRYKGK